MALTTRTAVKLSMGIPVSNTVRDALIDARILGIDALIKRWLGRNIEKAVSSTQTEYLDGLDTVTIRIRETPVAVAELQAVYLDPTGYYGQAADAFAAGTRLTAGTDYFLHVDQPDGITSRCGVLERLNGYWPGSIRRDSNNLSAARGPGRGNIKVVHNGGFSVVPPDISDAANLMVARMISVGANGVMAVSESFEDRSISLNLSSWANFLFTPDIVSMLLPYRCLRA